LADLLGPALVNLVIELVVGFWHFKPTDKTGSGGTTQGTEVLLLRHWNYHHNLMELSREPVDAFKAPFEPLQVL
jgi:hypothetical protein